MKRATKIRLLMVISLLGLAFMLLGYYLFSYQNLPETLGLTGLMICVLTITFGGILALPSKIYLVILLMDKTKA